MNSCRPVGSHHNPSFSPKQTYRVVSTVIDTYYDTRASNPFSVTSVPSPSRAVIPLLVTEHCMVISLDRLEHVVAGVVKLVSLVRGRSRAVMECVYPERAPSARRDDGETIIVRESSRGQEITVSSPLTAQGADFQEEAYIPGDIHGASEGWDNPPSIPSDTSGMPTIASSVIYTALPDTSSSWPTLSDAFTLDESLDSLGTMTTNPWMPWNSSMAHSSFPWFMNDLEMPLELPDMAHPHEVVMHATSVQAGQAYLRPENICSTYTKPCHPFPETEDIGLQMAGAEVFGHIHEIPQDAVEGLNNFYQTQRRRDVTPTVIPYDILRAFVELYFEYFDSHFPFLHTSRFEDPDLPWILLLAVAAVGSHYSEIQGAEEYNSALSDLLARAVELPVYDNISSVDVTIVQCVFLLHVLWLFSGSHRDKIVLQHKRSSLATMCWDLLGKADKRRQSSQGELDKDAAWQAWITEESELRLVTCVRVLECLSHIFLGTPLVFNLREATRQLPCPETLWRSQNASEWKSRQENSTGIVVVSGIEVYYMTHHLSGRQPKLDAFTAKVILLELYIDDRNYYRQLRNSQHDDRSIDLEKLIESWRLYRHDLPCHYDPKTDPA
ncbi:hypothetical protein FPANT_2211 [Fusarium pseudoanthophilum]|uniref:Xylanolytic transcriptional activator regulatory domain-containing protein n=1 Tax=Fusarium pseudoanthophilum TaxID=48495 RepID=A0A8H5UVB2_9HYPO|nr:hypothetical protein FPANT_2211 [Fusarium pseudoanthophilum]